MSSYSGYSAPPPASSSYGPPPPSSSSSHYAPPPPSSSSSYGSSSGYGGGSSYSSGGGSSSYGSSGGYGGGSSGGYGGGGGGYGGGGGGGGYGGGHSGGYGGGGGGYGGGGGGGDKMGNLGASLTQLDWRNTQLVPFQKDFYVENPIVAARSNEEIETFRRQHEMTLTGTNIPRPVYTFEEASFPDYLLAEVKKAGFTTPTAIQMQGWPMALSGRDMIGIAKTGSGKVSPTSDISTAHPLLLLAVSLRLTERLYSALCVCDIDRRCRSCCRVLCTSMRSRCWRQAMGPSC